MDAVEQALPCQCHGAKGGISRRTAFHRERLAGAAVQGDEKAGKILNRRHHAGGRAGQAGGNRRKASRHEPAAHEPRGFRQGAGQQPRRIGDEDGAPGHAREQGEPAETLRGAPGLARDLVRRHGWGARGGDAAEHLSGPFPDRAQSSRSLHTVKAPQRPPFPQHPGKVTCETLSER